MNELSYISEMAIQPHVRSISLPSRLISTSLQVDDELNKLEAAGESEASFSSLQAQLVGLAELYGSFSELVQSPMTQQALLSHERGRLVEDALDDSVTLINTCSAARELAASFKDRVRDLQSALRRRSGVESSISAYVGFRKRSKKEIAKCVNEIKRMEVKSNGVSPLIDADHHLSAIVRVFGEVISVAIRIFKSLLLFLSVPVVKPNTSSKWQLISKWSNRSRNAVVNEVASVDVALLSMQSRNCEADLQGRLSDLDCGCENLENAMEKLFRCLVQNRVCLLNVLTH